MVRVNVYIDGFNVYHRLDDYAKATDCNLKWLDYYNLLASLANNQRSLNKVYFFTAIDTRRSQDVIDRHNTYLSALESTGINIVAGTFKYKQKSCHNCGATWQTAEEKETDVFIGSRLVADALLNHCEEQWIVSGDTDLLAAVKTIKLYNPSVVIKGLIPPRYNPNKPSKPFNKVSYYAYRSATGENPLQLTFNQLAAYPLPDRIKAFDKVIQKPLVYGTLVKGNT